MMRSRQGLQGNHHTQTNMRRTATMYGAQASSSSSPTVYSTQPTTPSTANTQKVFLTGEPLDFATVITPLCISIYGGSNTGKSSIAQTFISACSERFDIVMSMCPTVKERMKHRWILHDSLALPEYDADVLKRMMVANEQSYEEGYNIPAVCLFLDDAFTKEKDAEKVAKTPGSKSLAIKNDATLGEAYRRARHLNFTIIETKHDPTDTGKKHRDSLHMVILMTLAKPELKEAVFKAFFTDFFANYKEFAHHIQRLAGKGVGIVLYDNAVYYVACKSLEMMPKFTVSHHDVYVAMHLLLHKKPSNNTKKGMSESMKQGLAASKAYREAMGFDTEDATEPSSSTPQTDQYNPGYSAYPPQQ